MLAFGKHENNTCIFTLKPSPPPSAIAWPGAFFCPVPHFEWAESQPCVREMERLNA